MSFFSQVVTVSMETCCLPPLGGCQNRKGRVTLCFPCFCYDRQPRRCQECGKPAIHYTFQSSLDSYCAQHGPLVGGEIDDEKPRSELTRILLCGLCYGSKNGERALILSPCLCIWDGNVNYAREQAPCHFCSPLGGKYHGTTRHCCWFPGGWWKAEKKTLFPHLLSRENRLRHLDEEECCFLCCRSRAWIVQRGWTEDHRIITPCGCCYPTWACFPGGYCTYSEYTSRHELDCPHSCPLGTEARCPETHCYSLCCWGPCDGEQIDLCCGCFCCWCDPCCRPKSGFLLLPCCLQWKEETTKLGGNTSDWRVNRFVWHSEFRTRSKMVIRGPGCRYTYKYGPIRQTMENDEICNLFQEEEKMLISETFAQRDLNELVWAFYHEAR